MVIWPFFSLQHTIGQLRWCPDGLMLASCAFNETDIKIWQPRRHQRRCRGPSEQEQERERELDEEEQHERWDCGQTLKHTQAVSVIEWCALTCGVAHAHRHEHAQLMIAW